MKHQIAGLVVTILFGGSIGLITTSTAVLVGERLEEPDTPALALLLHGRWADGSPVDVERLSLKCTYFNGSSLVRDVHRVVGPDREEGISRCPSFRAERSR
jgi:hypothetical protein